MGRWSADRADRLGRGSCRLPPISLQMAERRYQVLPITLRGEHAAEVLPLLVDEATWIPVRLGTRWIVRDRRWFCMPSTLADTLRSLRLAYEWAEGTLGAELDDYLEAGRFLSGAELHSLIAHLRTRIGEGEAIRTDPDRVPTLARLSHAARTVRDFLAWAADPQVRGSAGCIPGLELAAYRERLHHLFAPVVRSRVRSLRIHPLTEEEDQRLRERIGPVSGTTGEVLLPLRFRRDNPFRPETRLRNWLMYHIARECGLRRGELLSLCLDDLPSPSLPAIRVRRRPHDPRERRRYRPWVKRGERLLPVSDLLRAGLRAYLTTPRPEGRRGAPGPYLFVSLSSGAALSISSADAILAVARRAGRGVGIGALSWHTLRHTWAEELTEDLLAQQGGQEERVLMLLCEAGGWAPGSPVPLHYIQNAVRRETWRFLRERAARLYPSST